MHKFVLAVALFATALSLTAQSKDPLIGTWTLDGTKSTFDPGPPPPGTRTMIFAAADNGIKHKMDPESPLDTVSLKRIDANTIERSGKIRGKVVETCTMKVSPDGKTLTVTTMGSIQGNDYSSVQVYFRQ